MSVLIGIIIPFIGTSLGALMVYFVKNRISRRLEIVILGFAAGVMMAASIWSLIIPAIEMSRGISWLPASIGLTIGILFFFLIDYLLNKKKIKFGENVDKMMLAITLHNIPEGCAVGIIFASYMLYHNVTLTACYALSLGIAIQNIPEGLIVSLPLKNKGMSKTKAFGYGIISAIFELMGAVVTLIFSSVVSVILPYLLAFAAGAMIYVIVVELIPESTEENKVNTLGFLLGFMIMMILDVALG